MTSAPAPHDPERPSPDVLVDAATRAFEARQARAATTTAAAVPGLVQIAAGAAPAIAGTASGHVLLGLATSGGFLMVWLVAGRAIKADRDFANGSLADEMRELGVRLEAPPPDTIMPPVLDRLRRGPPQDP